METENQTNEQEIPAEQNKLVITNDISGQLKEAGKWGKFLAILGFVFMGLMVAGGFLMSIIMPFIPGVGGSAMPFPPFLFGIFYLIIGGVYFFPILYLYRFSNGIKLALLSNSQPKLATAFSNLKAHYRFIGIFTIVMFALYIVMLVLMMAVGLFAGFNGGFPGLPA